MEFVEVDAGIVLFRGRQFDANSTVILRGKEAFLVDGLASRAEAEELRRILEEEWKVSVRFILSTHYFSDHMAAFRLFPRAEIIAHRNAPQTFWSEEFRTQEEAGYFVEPTVAVSEGLVWKWGRYTLDIFYNPGHTASTLNVHVPEAGLLFAGDEAVGNIAYLHYSEPGLLSQALRRAALRGARRVVLAHGGVQSPEILENAVSYLDTLGAHVRETRAESGEFETIGDIPLGKCLAPGLEGTEFERFFHARNLKSIAARGLFPGS
jgi:glyoxylase-like metal-dependent hydrolase (beta-lactamase superfamily II)